MKKQQNDLCAQRRLRSVCASADAQSDIVFAGRIGHFVVVFFMRSSNHNHNYSSATGSVHGQHLLPVHPEHFSLDVF